VECSRGLVRWRSGRSCRPGQLTRAPARSRRSAALARRACGALVWREPGALTALSVGGSAAPVGSARGLRAPGTLCARTWYASARTRSAGRSARSDATALRADWSSELGTAGCAGCLPASGARGRHACSSARSPSGPPPWSGGDGGLPALLQDLYSAAQAPGANPVQVMTIHRAKGLEFDMCWSGTGPQRRRR